MLLLELPLSDDNRKLLYQKLVPLPRLELLVIYLVKRVRRDGCDREALFLFDHVAYRSSHYDKYGFYRFNSMIYKLIIRWPKFGYLAIKACCCCFGLIKFVKKTNFEKNVTVDRFKRSWRRFIGFGL